MESTMEKETNRKGKRRFYFGRVCHKFKHNADYKRRILMTVCCYISFAVLGGTKGQMGPALLDLRLICRVDLEQGALIVAFLFIGLTLGSILSGILYHRTNKSIMFALCLLVMAVTLAAIPWCSLFPLMLFVHAVLGIVQGIYDASGITEMIRTWGRDSQTIVVGTAFLYNIGGVISPIIIAPFLVKLKDIGTDVAYNTTNLTSSPSLNITDLDITLHSVTGVHVVPYTPRIHIAYTISAIVCGVVAMMFIWLYGYTKYGCCDTPNKVVQKEARPTSTSKITPLSNHSSTFKISALLVMVTMSTLCRMIDNAFVAYLSTFCIDVLGWTTKDGSFVTSLYFVFVVIGCLCGTMLTKVMRPVLFYGIQIFLMLTSLICLLISAIYSFSVGIWISPCIFGYAKSILFPLTITWTNDSFMKVSGKTTSIFFTVSMVGSVTNPLMLGYIMTSASPMWFCYLFLIESIVLVGFFVAAASMERYATRIRKTDLVQTKTFEAAEALNEEIL